VTLRRQRMYDVSRPAINVAFAAGVRDFRGVSPRELDGRRQITRWGSRETAGLPEIDYDRVDAQRAWIFRYRLPLQNRCRGKALLKAFDMPFTN